MSNHVLIAFPDFRKLFIGRLISCVGDKFFTIAIAWWVLITFPEDGKIKLSMLMAFNVVPVIILGPMMGTLTDRWNKKHALITANIVRGSLLFFLTYMMYSGVINMPILYLISFFLAMMAPLFDTATQSSISLLTDVKSTPAAVSMNSSVTQVAAVVGALIGSVLIHWVGVTGAILFNACAYVVSLMFILGIKTPLTSITLREAFIKQFKEGFKYLVKNPPIYSLLISFAALNLFFAPITLFIPIMTKEVLLAGASTLALLEAALATGAVLLTVYLSFVNNTTSIYAKLGISSVIMGLSLIGISLTTNLAFIMLFLFIIGMALAYTNATSMTLFQHEVPQAIKGRFFAVLFTVAFAVMPFSYMMVGIILQYISVQMAISICGVAVALLAGVLVLIPRIEVPKEDVLVTEKL
jgi:DHA3 family macrolide efflux protein-like MFS transporter